MAAVAIALLLGMIYGVIVDHRIRRGLEKALAAVDQASDNDPSR